MTELANLHVIRPGDWEETIWKNGQGRSWSVCRSTDADVTDFDWSVSVAVLQDEREFSFYPGIDRTLAILDGQGMKIRLNDLEVVVTMESEPFAFEGDTRVVGDVVAKEPVTDFNVLTRRSTCHHTSERISVGGMGVLSSRADVLIAHAQSSIGGIEIEGTDVTLRARDTLIIKKDMPQSLCLRGDGTLFVTRIVFN